MASLWHCFNLRFNESLIQSKWFCSHCNAWGAADGPLHGAKSRWGNPGEVPGDEVPPGDPFKRHGWHGWWKVNGAQNQPRKWMIKILVWFIYIYCKYIYVCIYIYVILCNWMVQHGLLLYGKTSNAKDWAAKSPRPTLRRTALTGCALRVSKWRRLSTVPMWAELGITRVL